MRQCIISMIGNDGERSNSTIIIEMNNNQFPFGCYTAHDQTRKVFVKKSYSFRSQEERAELMAKLAMLRDMYHRNMINLRSIEEEAGVGGGGSVSVYYHYVPCAMEGAFPCLSQADFKQVHKQLIQLAIHLAKHYVLTAFSPARCGVVFLEDKFVVKYFLPPVELAVTRSRSTLERSVQLFKVQAMQMLDHLAHQDLLSEISSPSHDPSDLDSKKSMLSTGRPRKTNEPTKERRFSNFCSKMDLIARRKSQDDCSATTTGLHISGLKSTLRNFKLQSQRKRSSERSQRQTKERVQLLRARSSRAVRVFEAVKKALRGWVGLALLIRLCNQL